MRALVLDGESRGALAIVRSLGRRGISVYAACEADSCLAGSSRYCAKLLQYPSPRASAHLFAEWLVRTLESMPDTVLYSAGDVTVSLISRNREHLPLAASMALAPQESVEVALNKAATLDVARRLSVPTPGSVLIEGPDSPGVREIGLSYPVVVKGAISDAVDKIPTAYASSEQELADELGRAMRRGAPVLVQELIPGEGTAIFALCDRGEPLRTFAHVRRREHPPWGGVSALSESIEEPADTLDYAVRILRELRWHGVAMVEFKRRLDGTACLMEINPRFWGSLELAVRSGVDFPYMQYQLVSGFEVERPKKRRRVANQWALGHLDSLITALRTPVWPDGRTPSRLRTLFSYLADLKYGACFEVEQLGDLRPAIYESRNWLCAAARAVLGSQKRGVV